MKTSTFAPIAALLSTSYAATVILETTACLDPTYPSAQPLEVELNTSGPVAVDLPTVCGLRIAYASSDVDITTITCQAFKDAASTQPGSALFTYASPALIATNPVQEKSIKCTYPVPASHERRQFNETVTPSSAASTRVSNALGSTSLPASSEASAASEERSTVTSIVVVTPSAGMPSPSGNSTTSVVTSRTPSQSSAPPTDTPGAAAEVGVGMGVAFAAVLAMFV